MYVPITVKCDASNLQKYYEIYSLVILSFRIQKLLNADIMNLTFLFLVSYFTYAVYNILLTMYQGYIYFLQTLTSSYVFCGKIINCLDIIFLCYVIMIYLVLYEKA